MTDREILKLYLTDQEKAFNELVEAYSQRLYWHIRSIVLSHEDANDVLQNVLIKIWQGLSTFRGDSQLYTWLYRIATNEVLTFIKRENTQTLETIPEKESQKVTATLIADEYFEGDKLQALLQEAIAQLPPKQRLVFNMRYFEDMKYEDMSKILDTSTGALKASYHHAAEKVEQYIKDRM